MKLGHVPGAALLLLGILLLLAPLAYAGAQVFIVWFGGPQ